MNNTHTAVIDLSMPYPIAMLEPGESFDNCLTTYLNCLQSKIYNYCGNCSLSELSDRLRATVFITANKYNCRIHYDFHSRQLVSTPSMNTFVVSSSARSHMDYIDSLVDRDQSSQYSNQQVEVQPQAHRERKNILQLQRDLEYKKLTGNFGNRPVPKEVTFDSLLSEASQSLIKATQLTVPDPDRLIPDVEVSEDEDEDENENKRKNEELSCTMTSDDIEKQIRKLENIKEKEIERIRELRDQVENDRENLTNYNFDVSGERVDLKRRKERENEHYKVFESERRFTYEKMKKKIKDGKLQEWNIPPFFMARYTVYKYMDDNNILYCENAYDIYTKLVDEIVDDSDAENDINNVIENAMGIPQNRKQSGSDYSECDSEDNGDDANASVNNTESESDSESESESKSESENNTDSENENSAHVMPNSSQSEETISDYKEQPDVEKSDNNPVTKDLLSKMATIAAHTMVET
jgi:hypothetical protein